MSVRVKLVQQMSGSRGDGTPWPPLGSVIEVGEDEAEDLCRRTASTLPIAERVEAPGPEPEPKTEKPPAEPKTTAPRATAAKPAAATVKK